MVVLGVTIKKVGNFKKVKTLTFGDNSALIVAIKGSGSLELNEDDTKVRKASKVQFQKSDNADLSTEGTKVQSRALVMALKDKKLETSIYAVRTTK